MTSLPDGAKRLLDSPEFATVATLEPDGRPHLSVVWMGRDGDDILFSTIRGN
jgi:Pyridoxamine 5'-phosphate oxidase